jgi:hypothetical protein
MATPNVGPPQTDPSQVSQIQQHLQQIAQTPPQPVPQAGPDQGSPVRRFLTNFFYGAGQGLLQHVGLPTDYDKQQNVIAQNQRQQQISQSAAETSSLIGLHQQQLANEKQSYAQNQYENEQLPIPGEVAEHFPGQTTARRKDINTMLQVGSALNQKQPIDLDDNIADIMRLPRGTQVDPRLVKTLTTAAGMSPSAWQIKDANGYQQQENKITGEVRPVLDKNGQPMRSNNMLTPWVRAKANAANTPFPGMDAAGNPTTISNAQALATGAPKMPEGQTMTLQGDRIGAQTYLSANKNVEDNLAVLRDPTQHAIIARTMDAMEKEPGAAGQLINSALQSGLSPEGAKLIGGLKQMNEFGSSFKKYTGNGGAATDALRATIHGNQPNAANSEAVNRQLLQQDRALAGQVQQMLSRPGAYAPPARNAAPPAPSQSGSDPFAQFKRNR